MARRTPLVAGRYAVFGEIASGGMASVHLARMGAPGGFSRAVAVKRLHPQFAKDPEFVDMFLDEARLCGRIRHPNVVSMLDVIAENGELLLVMEYVDGETLAQLARLSEPEPVPVPIACAIVLNILHGLDAAHDARSERGAPLDIIHRDVSPQNILVSADGVARLADFGIAKAVDQARTTSEGQLKGKMAYMAPEQLRGGAVDRRVDVYAASVVLWEILTGARLFAGDNHAHTYTQILSAPVQPPSLVAGRENAELDAVVLRGLERVRELRYASAGEMARELEAAVRPATTSEVSAWVRRLAGDRLRKRADWVAAAESGAEQTAEVGGAFGAHLLTAAASGSAPPDHHLTWPDAPVTTQRVWRRPLLGVAAGVALVVGVLVVAVSPLRARDPVPAAAAEPLASATDPAALPSASSSLALVTTAPVGPPAAAAGSAQPPAAPTAPTAPTALAATAASPSAAVRAKHVGRAGGERATGSSPCRVLDAAGVWHIRPDCR